MKNRHKDFPSDVFLTLSACDASITLADAASGNTSEVKVIDIMNQNLAGKLIISVSLPPMTDETHVSSHPNEASVRIHNYTCNGN